MMQIITGSDIRRVARIDGAATVAPGAGRVGFRTYKAWQAPGQETHRFNEGKDS